MLCYFVYYIVALISTFIEPIHGGEENLSFKLLYRILEEGWVNWIALSLSISFYLRLDVFMKGCH